MLCTGIFLLVVATALIGIMEVGMDNALHRASSSNASKIDTRTRSSNMNIQYSETQTPGGLVFTNNRGQIIFVNQVFLDLLGFDRRATIMGKPLHQVLGVGSSDV